jgi:hypothetical protein
MHEKMEKQRDQAVEASSEFMERILPKLGIINPEVNERQTIFCFSAFA